MKRNPDVTPEDVKAYFSALGRAVWDETRPVLPRKKSTPNFSALGRAVWDETHLGVSAVSFVKSNFSALGRAVWDETRFCNDAIHWGEDISVLSVEPYGMKLYDL